MGEFIGRPDPAFEKQRRAEIEASLVKPEDAATAWRRAYERSRVGMLAAASTPLGGR